MADNLALIESAAAKLDHLLPEVVFVGGSTLGLLVTDEAAAPIRTTDDVDVVVGITSYVDYVLFAERLRRLGFAEDSSPEAPLCRFLHGDLILDVMPVDEGVLGFSNRWYPQVLQSATEKALPSGRIIRLVTAPLFLGTKMEAFRRRGGGDYWESHDLEDFIAVVDGRDSLLGELTSAPEALRLYLRQATAELLADAIFRNALYGYVPGDPVSQQRVPTIVERLQAIAGL